MTPTDAINLFKILATIDWRELDRQDHMTFCGAGPDARIATLNKVQHGNIAELLDFRATVGGELLAIIGGDSLQLEMHGITTEGEPICFMLPLTITEPF